MLATENLTAHARAAAKTRVRASTQPAVPRTWASTCRSARTHSGNSRRAEKLAAGSRKYLSPEPLLQSPGYMTTMAARGMQVPTYAYAANNPLRYVDQNGLYFTSSSSAVWGALQRLAANPRTRWVVEMMAADPNVEFAINEVPYEQCAESGGITWLPFQRDARGTQSIQIDVNLTKANFARSGFSDDPVPWTLDSLVGHELGHGFGFAYGALNFDAMAVEVENYLRLPGPLRESHDRGVCKRPMPEICGR